jgi:hypothetical protein
MLNSPRRSHSDPRCAREKKKGGAVLELGFHRAGFLGGVWRVMLQMRGEFRRTPRYTVDR